MTASLGRRLVEALASDRIELHRAAWPEDEKPYQELVGKVLGRVLSAERVISVLRPGLDQPAHLEVLGLDDAERALLDSRLPPPPPPDRRTPAAKRFARWAVELPRAKRVNARFARSWTPESSDYVELRDGSTMLVVFVIGPLLEELAQVLRLRSGEGPRTLKGRLEAVGHSIEAHETLGLDRSGVLQVLDPTLDAVGVVEARSRLVESWAVYPEDLGARAMALLCTQLAGRYYAKARKDGTALRAKVLTSTVQPLLDTTFGTWEALLRYLDEAAAEADAKPLELDEVRAPDTPPSEVVERTALLRDWWTRVLDPAHAEQRPSMPSPWGLVPSPHAWEGDDEGGAGESYDPSSWASRLPEGMQEQIEGLWATTVLARHPSVLVDEPHPEGRFASVLGPAVRVWEGALLTVWFLCFGPYSRTTLDRLQEYHEHALDELSELGCPIESAVFRDLVEAGRGTDWLFQQGLGVEMSITISDDGRVDIETQEPGAPKPGSNEVFLRLRDVTTRHRRAWIATYLDRYLEAIWRRDLGHAAEAYRELHVGRGKPPTVKQAFPKLRHAALAWFDGDLSKLARCLNLEGPVTEPMRRSDLTPPEDMDGIRKRVCELLGGSMDPESNEYWLQRRRYELSLHVGTVLMHWQASGELPGRPAAMEGRGHLLGDAFPEKDANAGYDEYLDAIRQALREVGHPGAEAPVPETRGGRPAGR